MTIRLLHPGEQLELPGIGKVTVHDVQRRNWSRVARATDTANRAWFVKQFVAASGAVLAELYAAERATAQAMRTLEPTTFRAVLPIAAVEERLLLAYEYLELVTVDRAADDPSEADRLSGALSRLFDELSGIAPPSVPHKDDLGRPAFQWKGLDVKNLAVGHDDRLLVFDFGPAVVGSRRTAVTRFIGSVLVAGWGRSLRGMLSGPPPWASELTRPLRPLTTGAEVLTELAKLRRVRTEEPGASGPIRRNVVGSVTRVASRPYWSAAERWVTRHHDWEHADDGGADAT